jgi:hypothetical protein
MAASLESFGEVPRDQILIYVRTSQPVPAGEAGRLLTAFDRGFRRFVRQRTGRSGVGLQIIQIGADSFWVRLTAAVTAHEVLRLAPDLIPMFLDSISYALKLAMDHDLEDIPKYLKDLLRSIGQTGKRTQAEVIDLVSAVRVSIDPVAFDLVTRPDTSRRRPTPKESELPRLPVGWQPDPYRLAAAGSLAQSDALVAKLFNVDGKWYGRPEGMHDVMLPLKLDPYALEIPEPGREYRIRGNIERSEEGYPIAIKVDRLRPTESAPPIVRLPPPFS